MTSIKIEFCDGSPTADFPHKGRAGGSYTKSVRYEGGFVIVTDEWGSETAYPESRIKAVHTREDT